MLSPHLQDWRDDLILTRDITVAGARSEFYSAVKRGEFVKLFRGAYVSSDLWQRLDADERYRTRVKAAALFLEEAPVFCDASAASLWRLPWVGHWPQRVHAVVEGATGGRSRSVFIRHSFDMPAGAVEIDGLLVTTLERTVVDVARTLDFSAAVAVADAALRRSMVPLDSVPATSVTREDLVHELTKVPMRHGTARARAVIEFADGAADRPGESISRVSIATARLPRPVLQAPLYGASGRRWIVDFWWPEFNLIGEFDGKAKYRDAEFLRGRTPEQALMDEKEREDDLRASGRGMSRWGWNEARSPALLRRKLVAAGLSPDIRAPVC